MEELRTTAVLEREILDDARKKAARLLRTADDSLAQQKRDWDKKLADDLESIRKAYMNRMKKTVEDIFARQPLDKRRLRLRTHEEFLSAAINDFLSGLDRTRLLSVLEGELLRLLETVGFENGADSGAAVVRYSGLTLAETQSILKKSSVSFDWQFQEDLSSNDLSFNDKSLNDSLSRSGHARFPLVVIETGAFRITASVEAAAASLLKDNREELAAALLGQGVLHD
jgi:vacuolar-type H+-ATPase subunit H/predicted HTH domain antitoxin